MTVTVDERKIIAAIADVCDSSDWSSCRAHYGCGGEPTKEQRASIRSLVARGLLHIERGGQDDEGQFIGGTFYGVTNAGRVALNPGEPS